MMGTCVQLDISLIRTDGGTQPRAELNQSHLDGLVELLREGGAFKDPVVVFYDGTNYWLADGFHRLEATKIVGLATIDADIKSGTCEDAIEFSCGANATHGLPRNSGDKTRAVERLITLSKWKKRTQTDIAKQCHVSQGLVSRILHEKKYYCNNSAANQPTEPDDTDKMMRLGRAIDDKKRNDVEEWFKDNPTLHHLSNREIARRCKVTEHFIRNIRKELLDKQQKAEQELARPELKEPMASSEFSKEAACNTSIVEPKSVIEPESDVPLVPSANDLIEIDPEGARESESAIEQSQLVQPELEQEQVTRNASITEPRSGVTLVAKEKDSIVEIDLRDANKSVPVVTENEPVYPSAPERECNTRFQLDQEMDMISKAVVEPEVADSQHIQVEEVEKTSSLITSDPVVTTTERSDMRLVDEYHAQREQEREARRERIKERNERLREQGVELPLGVYSCLVVDPPWSMHKIEREERPNQMEFDYPTMTEAELRAFPLPEMAAENCHLYLWTTQKHLPLALELTGHWGFKYQCIMTWIKNVGFTPFSWMYSTEHVLFCTKGSLPLLQLGRRLDFGGKVREHSRKPDEFYSLVREVSPGPRLDVFSREKREGFKQYGNEADKYECGVSTG